MTDKSNERAAALPISRKEWDSLNEQAARLLQGVDDDMRERIKQGESVYEAQFHALYERLLKYPALSPEWRWFYQRTEGAYHELLQFERAARQETEQEFSYEIANLADDPEIAETNPDLFQREEEERRQGQE